MDIRLIDDPPAEGTWNMAVDEALLESSGNAGNRFLRFYRWSPATLSLGYFQRAEDRKEHLASRGLPMVRRPTGGGAIVHDHELTYCLVAPVANRFTATEQLVADVHLALVTALGDWGIRPSLWPGDRLEPNHQRPFLCFQRRARHDVVLSEQKIAGSAQRRHKRAALAHGSVLLSRSKFAPELAGIAEITGQVIPPDQLAAAWSAGLAGHFGWRAMLAPLTRSELESSDRLRRQRYVRDAWNLRR